MGKRDLKCSGKMKKNEMIKNIMKRQGFFALFCFWENVLFTSYVACYVTEKFSEMLYKIDVLKNYVIFKGKHLC